jgi:hypothetical protein
MAVHGGAISQQRNLVLRLLVSGLHAGHDDGWPEGGADNGCQGLDLLTYERHLAPGREVEVERLEQVSEGLRVVRRGLVQKAEHVERHPLVLAISREGREAHERKRRG